MTLTEVSQVLIGLALADWFVTIILVASAWRIHESALTERAIAAVILTGVASVGALLGAHVLGLIAIPDGLRTVILVGGFMAVSLPQLIWFGLLLAGRFR